MAIHRRRRSGAFKKPKVHRMPQRRDRRARKFRLPKIRMDFMNVLIVLVLAANALLIGFGVRQCAGRKTAASQTPVKESATSALPTPGQSRPCSPMRPL